MHPFLVYYHNPATTHETLEQKAFEFQSLKGTAVHTLAEAFVADYARAEAYFLLQIIQEQGSKTEAELLYEACVVNHRLKEKVSAQLLETFGKLKYEPAFKMLYHYALEALQPKDYYTNMYAVFGLIAYQPQGLDEVIKKAITTTFGQTFFCEYLPALALLLPPNDAIAQPIYESYINHCAEDCSAGYKMALEHLEQHKPKEESLFEKLVNG
ncbi:hypothetical protein FLCU109888_07345 [Flavobacterium cucumis]|uniref:Tetratricopeptide repeat-containing protein n=1 Tax=Flavobacterium cucumis TaxID=416016 RepID=A0A1M7ZWI6_9FLAO|nr:hypothetical protein [Flavobacterium cucumis]SHO73255.1 hypothetical protein SAMN05443547_1610 [Flavobacterium cucumis]